MDKKTDQQAPSSAPISGQLMDDLVALRAMFGGSADLTIRRMTICSHEIALVTVEGMVDRHMMADAVILPMTRMTGTAASPEALISRIRDEVLGFVDLLQVTTLDELTNLITSGFAAILTEGVPYAVLGGLQGFMMRGVSEPSTEVTVRGSREGFTEAIRINMSMVRRRLKSPSLTFETLTVGKVTQTAVCLCYMQDRVSRRLLDDIRARIQETDERSQRIVAQAAQLAGVGVFFLQALAAFVLVAVDRRLVTVLLCSMAAYVLLFLGGRLGLSRKL